MCCFFTLLVFFGPRFAGLFAWLVDPMAFKRAFADHSTILPLLLFIFLPWTLLMYVIVAPGGLDGFDWVWLGLAVFFDVAQWAGGGYGNRYQIYEYVPAAANPSIMPPTEPPVPPSQAAAQPPAEAPAPPAPSANPPASS